MDSSFFHVLHNTSHHRSGLSFSNWQVGFGFGIGVKIGHHIDVNLGGFGQEPVDQNGSILKIRGFQTLPDVDPKRGFVVAQLHAAAAQHIRRTDQDWISDASGNLDRFIQRVRDAVFRLPQIQLAKDARKAVAIFGQVNRIQTGTQQRNTGGDQAAGQVQRRLSAKLHHHADHPARTVGTLQATTVQSLDGIEGVLEGQRLKEQQI